MNSIADRLDSLVHVLRSVLEKQALPKESNLVKFEQSKNAVIQRKPDKVTEPKAYELWKQEISTENGRSHTLPFEKSREYLHAAIFGGDADLHDAAMGNTHLTTREEKLLKGLVLNKARWGGPESAEAARKALRQEGDRCLTRHKAVLYKADGDTYYSNHAHSPNLWKQMSQLYSQPNNMTALDSLPVATERDAEPLPFKKLREHKQNRAKLSEQMQQDMRKKATAGLLVLGGKYKKAPE